MSGSLTKQDVIEPRLSHRRCSMRGLLDVFTLSTAMKTSEQRMGKLTGLVNTHIEKITANQYSQRQLVTLFRNVDGKSDLLDEDRERLIYAIETHLRSTAPNTATKLFGPKDSESRETLNRIWIRATENVDVSANFHNNGVKTGGAMMKGEMHVDVYISYRNREARTVRLNITQKTPSDPFVSELAIYVVGGEVEKVTTKPAEMIDELGLEFAKVLQELTYP